MKKFVLIASVLGLAFIGCDNGNGGVENTYTVKIEVVNAQVIHVNPQGVNLGLYTGNVNSISLVNSNVSGSITNGKLDLIIDAPTEEQILEFKNHPYYSMLSDSFDFDVYYLYYLLAAFPVIEATTGTKMVLSLFRDGDIGNGTYQLLYSTGSGEIVIPFGSIAINEGWNFLNINSDTNFMTNIPFPIGDDHKWYIWEGEFGEDYFD